MTWNELYDIATDAVGARRPRVPIPFALSSRSGRVGDLATRILRRDLPINSVAIRLAHIMSPMDHSKAVRELGWQPEPASESIRKAARWFEERRGGRRS